VAGIILIIIGWFSSKVYAWFKLARPLSKVLGTLADNTKRVIIVVPKLYSLETFKLKNLRIYVKKFYGIQTLLFLLKVMLKL